MDVFVQPGLGEHGPDLVEGLAELELDTVQGLHVEASELALQDAVSATVFLVLPPSRVATLKVVSESRRPWGSFVMSSRATRMAERPFSRLDAGVCGASGDLYVEAYVGRLPEVMVLGGPSPSNTTAVFERTME